MFVVVACSLPFLYVLARRPVLRRLATRNAVRRPRETMLVILGSLLGTAIMTGSFVVGDTFTASIRRGAYEQLGPIDEVVSVGRLADGEAVRARLAGFGNRDVDGVLSLTVASAAAATTTTPRRAAPSAQLLETDFTAARRFGGVDDGDRYRRTDAADRRDRDRRGSQPRVARGCRRSHPGVRLRRLDAVARDQRLAEARHCRLLDGRSTYLRQRVRGAGHDREDVRARYARARSPAAVDGGRLESGWGRSAARGCRTR